MSQEYSRDRVLSLKGRCLLVVFLLCGVLHASPGCAAEQQNSIVLNGLWTRQETLLSVGVIGAAGLASLWDEDVHSEMRRSRSSSVNNLADGFDLLGHPATGLGASALLWGIGTWREDSVLAQTGQLAFEAVFLSQVATAAVKVGFGRHRPDVDEDAWSFRPLSFSGQRHSLSSAHTANAFALAGVLSSRSKKAWAPWLCYGLAGLVGVSRVYDDEHWLSDVMVGALIGELSARIAMRFHDDNPGFFVGPAVIGQDGYGLRIGARW